MFQLIPCMIPEFNWNAIQSVRQVLGRSLVDTSLNLPDPRRFLVALERLSNPECDDWAKPSDSSLWHFPLSMMIVTSKAIVLDIVQHTQLRYLGAKDDLKDFAVGILSGNLHTWRLAHKSHEFSEHNVLRALSQQIKQHFERLGLSFVLDC